MFALFENNHACFCNDLVKETEVTPNVKSHPRWSTFCYMFPWMTVLNKKILIRVTLLLSGKPRQFYYSQSQKKKKNIVSKLRASVNDTFIEKHISGSCSKRETLTVLLCTFVINSCDVPSSTRPWVCFIIQRLKEKQENPNKDCLKNNV